ncbi:hypothetical protein SAY86_026145 [Trapa natans]|uniref:Uncharacterized protein n=1 Tax=Trapa natans TaxID=22666 RepID=A0AAN7KL66_TRANT|nr:hypothetical protein SAY86_026145 [Trapa natans]
MAELDIVLRQLDFFRQQEAVTAAAVLGCDLMSPGAPVPSSAANPFFEAFANPHNVSNSNNHDGDDDGFVKEFNVNLNNSCDAVAWAMQDCATPTSNDNNGVNAIAMPHPHQKQQQHLIHHHVGDGTDVVDHDNSCSTSRQMGFDIPDHCIDHIKPLILDHLSPDDISTGDHHRQQDLGFPSEDAIDKCDQSILELDQHKVPEINEGDEDIISDQRRETIDVHHDHNDLKDAATFFSLTNCSS